ncbi:hypothetical protein GEMRC1_000223 [Eukaryota sp. GEM-RC1]
MVIYVTPRQRSHERLIWTTHTMFGNPKEWIIIDIMADEDGYLSWPSDFLCRIVDTKEKTHPCDVWRDGNEITAFIRTSQR